MKKILFLLLTFSNLTMTIAQNSGVNNTHLADSLLEQLNSGNDDFTIITELYKDDPNLSEDSINKLFKISNENYFKNNLVRDKELEMQFRSISLSDQLYRIRCYFHRSIEYSVVQKNDSALQVRFLTLVNEHNNLSLTDRSFYQQTFQLLLIHSVATPKTHFFENNFHRYSSGLFNDFKKFTDLQIMLDMYLKFKYNKQFFNTEAGKGILPDHSFGLLPKITDTDFKKVLSELKVENAIY